MEKCIATSDYYSNLVKLIEAARRVMKQNNFDGNVCIKPYQLLICFFSSDYNSFSMHSF